MSKGTEMVIAEAEQCCERKKCTVARDHGLEHPADAEDFGFSSQGEGT